MPNDVPLTLKARLSHTRSRKLCTFIGGCKRVAVTKGLCVRHGGGKKCMLRDCNKGAQAGGYCRQHGGGARCQIDGCKKFDAGRGFCRAHGGGKRCQEKNCVKADVGGGYCTAHGGGKRCRITGCVKIAQEGGKCRAHGGVRRCRHSDCANLARGHNGFCSQHGGAQLCASRGCRRLAKGGTKPLYCLNCVAKCDGAVNQNGLDVSWLVDAMASSDEAQKEMVPKLVTGAKSSNNLHHMNGPSQSITTSHYSALTILSERVEKKNLPVCSEGFQAMERDEQSTAEDTGDLLEDDGEDFCISQTGSCLLNGCAKSFGGSCNCSGKCECCATTNGEEYSITGRIERKCCSQSTHRSTLTQPSITENPVAAANITCCDKTDGMTIKRTKLRLGLPKNLVLTKVVALLKTLSNVRSVHVLTEFGHDKNGEDMAIVMIVGTSYLDVTELELLRTVSGTRDMYAILEQSEMPWSQQEIIFYIPEMMCKNACGNTVISAIHSSNLQENLNGVQLEFEQRLVICRGYNLQPAQLRETIRLVGFEPQLKQVAPIPKEFMFRTRAFLDQKTSCRLRGILADVEGVEQISVMHSFKRVFVSGFIESSQKIIDHAANHDLKLILTDTESGHVSLTHEMANTIHSALNHECDNQTCSRIGCEQYRATVAHTAALAAGWIVPGCAMVWGGECTCGEDCKCKGCPKHDPITF